MSEINTAIEMAFNESYAMVVSNLSRQFRDIDLAEEAIQDAFAEALRTWPGTGPPDNPGGWIATVSRRRAIDKVRREKTYARKKEILAGLERGEGDGPETLGDSAIPDDRLEMMFACCHPALSVDKQVALTLRTLGGLTTREVAEAFLVPEATMAQRLVRAKAKVRNAGIPFTVPTADQLAERLEAVLSVIYLVFNEGYFASSGNQLVREELAGSALELGRMLAGLLPEESECRGLLALMMLQHSRRSARADANGDIVLLEDQDRDSWDRELIEEGLALVASIRDGDGPYGIQAAIAACHSAAPSWEDTDWKEMVRLYDRLWPMTRSPVVGLNRAVAVGEAFGPGAGLKAMSAIELDGYHAFHTARGELLRRVGDRVSARREFERALELVNNAAERRLLEARIGSLGG